RPARGAPGHATARRAWLRSRRRRPATQRRRARARRFADRHYLQRRTAGGAHLALTTHRHRRAEVARSALSIYGAERTQPPAPKHEIPAKRHSSPPACSAAPRCARHSPEQTTDDLRPDSAPPRSTGDGARRFAAVVALAEFADRV